jgi:hypothetical protein
MQAHIKSDDRKRIQNENETKMKDIWKREKEKKGKKKKGKLEK